MTFGSPSDAFERAAARAVADVLGHDPPPWWSVEEHRIGIHEDDPSWAYLIVRIPVVLGSIVEEIGKEERPDG